MIIDGLLISLFSHLMESPTILVFSVSKPSEEEFERVTSPRYEEKEPGFVDPCEEYGSFNAEKVFLVFGVSSDGNSSNLGFISLNYEKILCLSLLSCG